LGPAHASASRSVLPARCCTRPERLKYNCPGEIAQNQTERAKSKFSGETPQHQKERLTVNLPVEFAKIRQNVSFQAKPLKIRKAV
jgi:hypothetical protein